MLLATGMLISSVTLGLLSDKYGRKRMIWIGFVISVLATISALLAQNYLLLNISYMLMSFSQVGVANALCILGKLIDVSIEFTPNQSLIESLPQNKK